MLFNSELFVFLFLPLCLIVFFTSAKFFGRRIAIAWLVAASCIFYAWHRLDYLLLLAGLIVFNYLYGAFLSKQHKQNHTSRLSLWIGILVNLSVLIYFKYTNFLITNINTFSNANFTLTNIVMPIGISFFIFQKIAYIVDAYRGEAEEYNFLDFCLFVMYFPQLIAGPIVHHKELIPQFRNDSIFKFNATDMSVGLFMFTVGLCKKICIADQLALWVDPLFNSNGSNYVITFADSWIAALGFTLQIYFDFSAYTDMALGLAMMIGIRLPMNFNSPYKATSIIDFWRKWHMSLSKFLRDYIYIPLGGNRAGTMRRYGNLLLTMLIGGFWHGAAWTFVFWGALHGIYLIINHTWRHVSKVNNWSIPAKLGTILTLSSVIVAWIFFRSDSFAMATQILKTMIGLNGIAHIGHVAFNKLLLITTVLCAVLILPNTQQICSLFRPTLQDIESIKPKNFWKYMPFIHRHDSSLQIILSPVLGIILALALLGSMTWQTIRVSPVKNFIYFQF